MARRLRIAAAVFLLALCAFLIWSGAVVGSRAFEAHPDSQPWVYVMYGGAYAAMGVICAAGSLVLLRWRRR